MTGVTEPTMLPGCTPWPVESATRYRALGHWRGETLGTLLRRWAQAHGGRTALVYRDRRISYDQLDVWADRLAAGFAERGIAPGDRVVLQLPNTPEFVAVFFGLLRAGAHPVFALAAHRATEIRHLCSLSGAVGYVVPDEHLGYDYRTLAKQVQADVPTLRQVFVAGEPGEFTALDEVPTDPATLPESSAANVAFFLLSGGTTALPKLIPRTHDDYAYQVRTATEVCGLGGDDVCLVVLPIEFNFPWGCPGVLGTLSVGGTVVLAEDASADHCFSLIERERVTRTSLVPTIAQMWVDESAWTRRDLSTMVTVQVGGAPLAPELAARIGPALDCRLQQVFGMAEGLLTFTRQDDDEETVFTTQGSPMSPDDELRVVDDDDRPLPPGEPGHLLVRGPYTLRGYFRAPEHNARAFTADGFYRTGDLVRYTASGRLMVEGRAKDVIIRGGDKVSAAEIEGHLLRHPAVRQAAAVAVPDPFLGERTCVFVVADEGAEPSLAELKRALHGQGLADYKLPDQLRHVEELPLTPLGKVDKKALAATVKE